MQEIAAACVTDHMLPISRAINKLLASHSMPLTNGYLIIILRTPCFFFLKSQVPVVEMQKSVLRLLLGWYLCSSTLTFMESGRLKCTKATACPHVHF